MDKELDRDHSRHRQRFLKKMETEELGDVELLELLLFYVFKRRNTNDLAHRLISEFGGLRRLFEADMERLQQIEGVGKQTAAFICALASCNRAVYRPRKRMDLTIWDKYDADAFIDCVKGEYENLPTEVLNFYLINNEGRMTMQRNFQGTEDAVVINFSEFTRILIENEPSGIIAVHNHPQGVAVPSADDNEMTKMCQLICSFHDVVFCDHIIVAEDGCYSYYKSGEMKKFFDRYAVQNYKGDEKKKSAQPQKEVEYSEAFKKDLTKIEFVYKDGRYVGVIEDK